MKRLLLLAVLAVAAWAQSATPIRYPGAIFKTPLTMEPQAVPTSPTVIITGNFILDGGWISCTTGQTITFTDGNSITMLPAIAVSPAQGVSLNIFAGAYFPTSVTIVASGSGCSYHIWGRQ